MASTLLLTSAWDLALDNSGDIALADDSVGLAQDAASSIRTFAGEYYWDTKLGVPYLESVFGKRPSLALMKQLFVEAALDVPDVAAAQCYIASLSNRAIAGQVQVVSSKTGQVSAANFVAINPQGVG
jgi:hypothetical protein